MLGPPPPGCFRCGLPRPGEPPACARCRRWPAGLSARAGSGYAGVAEAVVQALKYSGWRHLAGVCAEYLAAALERYGDRPDVLVPVPLHPTRLRERGFNQSALIAEALAVRVGLPVSDALVRARATASQVGLTRAGRAANVAGSFRIAARPPAGARVCLVDDVATSGATLAAAAAPLLASGACSVLGLTFALAAGGPRR